MKSLLVIGLLACGTSSYGQSTDVVFDRNAIPEPIAKMTKHISDIHVDSYGNTFFLNDKTNKITMLTISGEIGAEFPSKKYKLRMESPTAFTLNSQNQLVVADKSNIVIFDIKNKTSNSLNVSKSPFGGIDSPVDIKTDHLNNIYILDEGSSKLTKLNPNGLARASFSIESPISVTVDSRLYSHILYSKNKKYRIKTLSENFNQVKDISVSLAEEATDLMINSYGEYYLVDQEKSTVLHLDSLGKSIGAAIGVKSSDSGRGQFVEAGKVFVHSTNSKTDAVYILDEDVSTIQQFSVTHSSERTELHSFTTEIDVNFTESLKNTSFIDMIKDGSIQYTIASNYTVSATDADKTLFTLNPEKISKAGKVDFSEPSSLRTLGDNLYISDKDENHIVVFNKISGEFLFKISEKGDENGKLDTPTDLLFDRNDRLYVSNFDNNRIEIFTKEGIYSGVIPKVKNAAFINPKRITYDKNAHILYILLNKNNILFSYDLEKNTLKKLSLKYPFKENKITDIEISDDGVLLVQDSEHKVIYMFQNQKVVGHFLSEGKNETQIEEINRIYFNSENNLIYASNTRQNNTKTLKLILKPKPILNPTFSISENGNAIISWDKAEKSSITYTVYRKTEKENSLSFYKSSIKNSITIEEKTDNIYTYSIKALSVEQIQSEFSDNVTDEYTHLASLKDTEPSSAIDLYKSFLNENETAVKSKIKAIYRSQILDAKRANKFKRAIEIISNLQKIESTADLSLEKSALYKQLYDFKGGIKELNEAKTLFPKNYHIHNSLIRMATLDKNFKLVISSAKNGLSYFPSDERLKSKLGNAYFKENLLDEALAIFRELASEIGDEKYYVKAGEILITQEKPDDALQFYISAENAGKAKDKLYSALGSIYLQKKNYAEASFTLDKAVKINANVASYHYKLGMAYSMARNKPSAIASFERAIELNDARPDYFISLALDLATVSRDDDAILNFEKSLELAPDSVSALFNLGKLYLKKKKVDEACQRLADAKKLVPESKEISSYLEKALIARDLINAKRDPIEFADIKVDDIFPSLINYYKTRSIGSVSVYNTKSDAYEDVKLTVKAPDLSNDSTVIVIPIMLPNDKSENLLFFRLDEEKLFAKRDGSKEIDLEFTLSYLFQNKKTNKEEFNTRFKKVTIKLHPLNAITWDDKKHLASFINPANEQLRTIMTKDVLGKMSDIVLKYDKLPKAVVQSFIVWNYLKSLNLTYVSDPNSGYAAVSESGVIDYIQFATQTLARKSGDCDDLVTLLSNSLESIGITTAYVDVPGHVFLAFDTKVAVENIVTSGLNPEKVIVKWNKVWLPLEATVLGKNSFVESWNAAISRYNSTIKKNERAELVEINEAARIFPPTSYSDTSFVAETANIVLIKESATKDLDGLSSAASSSIENELRDILVKYPSNTYVRNKLALHFIHSKKYKKSITEFNTVLKNDENNLFTLVNLANIYYMKSEPEKAEPLYLKALELTPKNIGVLINLSRVSLAKGDKIAANKYFNDASQLNATVDSDYSDLKQMLVN